MPIAANSPLRSSVANDTFLDKTIDDGTVGKLALNNADPISGAAIPNAQEAINNNTNSIQAVLDQVNEGSITLKAYATDSAYETENGAPPYTGLTAIYYNQTTGLIRYYDGINTEWANVGTGGGVATQESIGTGNGVATDFSLTLIPSSDESVLVVRNGLVVDISEYTVNSGVVEFLVAPAAGQSIYAYYLTEGTPVNPPVGGGTFQVDYITLTSAMIANNQLTLANVPADPTKVALDVVQGSSQVYNVDYSVSSNVISWSGLGLQTQVTTGDILRFIYIS